MGAVIDFQAAKAAGEETDKQHIARCMAEIRSCGWIVKIVEDHGDKVLIDAIDGNGACEQMWIIPAVNRRDNAKYEEQKRLAELRD